MRTTIEMAREAAGDDWGLFQEFMPEIHKLAELVRADERARMATDKSKDKALKLALEKIANVNAMDYEYQAWAREALAEQPAQLAWTDKMTIDVPDQELYKAQPAPAQQKPVALKWQQAPVKTQWGDDMVVASVAIDKDHTVCLYCERDQTPKVDAMFAQRTWVNATTWRGLTDEEIDAATQAWAGAVRVSLNRLILCREFARAIEAKLRSKNEDRN